MIRAAFFLLATLFALILSETGGAAEQDNRQAYETRKAHLKSRYADFFKHHKKKKKQEGRRLEGRKAYRAKQDRWFKKWDKARRNYVPSGGKTYDNEKLQAKWEKKQEKKSKIEEKSRKEYIVFRDRLKQIEEESRRVPQEAEVGFISPDQVE